MGILKKLLIALFVLAGLFVVVGFLLPSEVHVERATTINAPASTVYGLVNSFESFTKWSPWYERDPSTKHELSGPVAGVGAKMSWTSDNPEVGSGTQEIVESKTDAWVRTALDFGEQGTATASYDIKPSGEGVSLTWSLDTDLGGNIIARYYGLAFDSMVGPDFEKGLAKLQELAESMPPPVEKPPISVIDVEAQDILYVSGSAGQEPGAISEALGVAYAKLNAWMAENKIDSAGPPMSFNRTSSDTGYEFDAAIPVASPPAILKDNEIVKLGKTPSGKSVRAVHIGPYDGLRATYDQINAYIEENNYKGTGKSWEVYMSDPQKTPQDELVTHVYFPVE